MTTAEQPPTPPDRERLGRVVREAWIKWARQQPSPKASWLVPWDGLSDPDKEVDRQIAEAVAAALRSPADGYREGAEAMREACGGLLPALMPLMPNRRDNTYTGGWIDCREAFRAAIRALPIPSPPEEKP
jgi:hypothetical protein